MGKVDAVSARLNAYCERMLLARGDETVTVNRLTHDALRGAEDICRADFTETVALRLRSIFRRMLQNDDAAVELPMLSSMGISALPRRIAVPPDDGWDEDDSSVQWPAIHKATIGQVKRNIAMRDGLIASSQMKRDKLHHLVLAAEHEGGKEDDVLFEVLSGAPAES